MQIKNQILIEQLTKLIRSRLLQESATDEKKQRLYQAFFEDPTNFILMVPDPGKNISGTDFTRADILSSTPDLTDPKNPKLNIKIWPSYEVYDYQGPPIKSGTEIVLKTGDRISYSYTDTEIVNVKRPNGVISSEERKMFLRHPSERYGGKPEDYVIPYDAPTPQVRTIRYKEAQKEGVEALFKKDRSENIQSMRSVNVTDITREDGEDLFNMLRRKTTLIDNLTDTDAGKLRTLFKNLYDPGDYIRYLRSYQDEAATNSALDTIEKVLAVLPINTSKKDRFLSRLESITVDETIPSKRKIYAVLDTSAKTISSIDPTSTKQAREPVHSLYSQAEDQVGNNVYGLKFFKRKLPAFKKFFDTDYEQQAFLGNSKEIFKSAKDDLLTAIQSEQAIKDYLAILHPASRSEQEAALNGMVNSIEKQLSDPGEGIKSIRIAAAGLLRSLPGLVSVKDALQRIYKTPYSDNEEGFSKAKEDFKAVLRSLDISNKERLDAFADLDALPESSSPKEVLHFINRLVREKEGILKSVNQEDGDGTNFSDMFLGRVQAKGTLPRKTYADMVLIAKDLLIRKYDAERGLSDEFIDQIKYAIGKADSLTALNVVVDESSDNFTADEVLTELLRHASLYAEEVLPRIIPSSTNRKIILKELGHTNGVEFTGINSSTSVKDFVEYFTTMNIRRGAAGEIATKYFEPGIPAEDVFSGALDMLRKAVVENKYIEGRAKNVFLRKFGGLKSGNPAILAKKVDEMFTRDLDDITSAIHQYKVQFTDAYANGLKAVRSRGFELYRERPYKELSPTDVHKDLQSFNTFEDLVGYLIEILGKADVESFVSKDLAADFKELFAIALSNIIEDTPGYTQDTIDTLLSKVEGLRAYTDFENFIERLYPNVKVLETKDKTTFKTQAMGKVIENLQVELSKVKISEPVQLHILHAINECRTESATDGLTRLDELILALTGINQTGLQSLMYTPGNAEDVQRKLAQLVAHSGMTTQKRSQVLSNIFGSSWNDQSDKRPMLSIPKLQLYSVYMSLAGEGLRVPPQGNSQR